MGATQQINNIIIDIDVQGEKMGWRNVIITQHAKLTYSMNMLIVQTKDGINQIPIEDINLVLISTSQAVITSALISKLAKNQCKVIFVDDKYQPVTETVNYYPGARDIKKLKMQFEWNERRKENLWTKIVAAKLKNQISVLKNYRIDETEVEQELYKLEVNDLSNREAAAARKYFMKLFGKDFIRRNSGVNYYPGARDIKKLKMQFEWNERRKENLWTKIVAAKLKNQISVLKNYRIDETEVEQELYKLEVNDLSNREAAAARKYFMKLFGKDFIRRNSGVINAALDYGYSILLSSFDREIAMNGYLTYLGIHHHSVENQFNLACDLMEPFRSIVDYWVKAHENITSFTPDIKYGLVELLSLQIKFNGRNTILTNAISVYVRSCLRYLSGETDDIRIEMSLCNEVPNDAINDNV